MSQPSWQDLQQVLEPLIRQIVQEELTKLSIPVGKLKKKQVPLNKKIKRSEQPLIGLWKDREDMQDVEEYVRQLRKPRY